jgi:two-component system, OmpR family, sensor histidine kinase BaeS
MRIHRLFRSITFKLTLAFLLVGLTGSVLVAVIFRERTQTAFDQFIVNRDQQVLVNSLTQYYQAVGSWEGVANDIYTLLLTQSRSPDPGRDFGRDWTRFILIDANQQIVYSINPVQIGQFISSHDLEQAIPLKTNGQMVGSLLLVPLTRQQIPDSPEARFFRDVNSATFISALVASALALILGGFLAFTMTRSLRELTEATVEISQGKLGRQVKVRSKDELGELASSFNKMSLDLEQATRARRQMTADIAHDLRSPLSVIAGYTEALSDGKLPSSPEIYNILHQETRHLNRLVDDLRTLSLADSGELSLTLLPAQPQALLERVAARHAVAAQQNRITLRVEPSQELPLVAVDGERMAQVLDNLILNAFRYTSPGGEIILSARTSGEKVLIQVRDNGSGIAPDDLPMVFDRFYRGDKSRQQNGESGLGLAIAKSIVEAHHGTILAKSEPGKGATFIISLEPLPSTSA